jgi:hypothetical protein
VRRFSTFSPPQTTEVIEKYAKAYEFSIEGPINPEVFRVLSHPFSLQVFAEANEYVGAVRATDVIAHNVLALYFERKKDDVLKRPIPGFQGDVVLSVCSVIAMSMVDIAKNEISRNVVVELIEHSFPILRGFSEPILNSLVSEQILVRDASNSSTLRFRHIRFLEYLVAYYIAKELASAVEDTALDAYTKRIFGSNFMSIYYVHDFIKNISETYFLDLRPRLDAYYSKDTEYMKRLVISKRSELANGGHTDAGDLDTIHLSMVNVNSDLCWDAFFVIAARPNNKERKNIIEAFELAWDSNDGRPDRWKIITKLDWHKLLLAEAVLTRILVSKDPKEWEVYLEQISNSEDLKDFPDAWLSLGGQRVCSTFKIEPEWENVIRILEYATDGKAYPKGASGI